MVNRLDVVDPISVVYLTIMKQAQEAPSRKVEGKWGGGGVERKRGDVALALSATPI